MTEDAKTLKNATKKSLRVMRRASGRHIVREKTRIIKYGASGFTRNIWLSTAATIVMSFTLVILFATVVASVVLNSTANSMREKIDITVYLKPNTSEEKLSELTDLMETDSNVKSVTTSTSEEEYKKFLQENESEDEILSVVQDDEDMKKIMISKMQSTMRIKVYDVDNLDSIKELVKTNEEFVENIDEDKSPTYDVNQKEIATITSWANIARAGGIILGIVFLVVSILIIFSTIRMAIFSRREEIYMMKLVGADKGFIRGPFIIEAEICGIIAGLISATASYFGFGMLAPKLSGYGIDISEITNVFNSNKLVLVYLIFIGIGIIIGRISARLAISRYIHRT